MVISPNVSRMSSWNTRSGCLSQPCSKRTLRTRRCASNEMSTSRPRRGDSGKNDRLPRPWSAEADVEPDHRGRAEAHLDTDRVVEEGQALGPTLDVQIHREGRWAEGDAQVLRRPYPRDDVSVFRRQPGNRESIGLDRIRIYTGITACLVFNKPFLYLPIKIWHRSGKPPLIQRGGGLSCGEGSGEVRQSSTSQIWGWTTKARSEEKSAPRRTHMVLLLVGGFKHFLFSIIEGSLEVKLPTICHRWKAEMGRGREKRRAEERRSEKRKSQK